MQLETHVKEYKVYFVIFIFRMLIASLQRSKYYYYIHAVISLHEVCFVREIMRNPRTNKIVSKESCKVDEQMLVIFRINFLDFDLAVLLCKATSDTGLRHNSKERVVN